MENQQLEEKARRWDLFVEKLNEWYMIGWDEVEEDFIEGESLGLDVIGERVLNWFDFYGTGKKGWED